MHKGKEKQNQNMAVNSGDNVAIDIEGLVSSIKDVSMSPKCCIFKTPIILRRLNEKAYVPDNVNSGDNVAIDIEGLVSSIKDVSMSPKCCIF